MKAVGLAFRHKAGDGIIGDFRAEAFLKVIAGIHLKINIQALKQFPPSGGIAAKDYMLPVEVHQNFFL